GPVVLVGLEQRRALAARQLDGNDLALELAGGLCGAEALLGAKRPLVLRLAADLELGGQILSMPTRRLAGEGVVQPVAQHAVIDLRIAHAIAPAPARQQEGR